MIKYLLLLLLVPHLSFAEDLRLLTWNVYMLPKPIKNSHQKTRTDFIAEYFRYSDADVVFLQEAFSGHFRRVLKKELKDKYPYHVRLKKRPVLLYPFLGPGLVAFSKYPIKTVAYDYYNKCARADCWASKGVHLTEIELPSGKLLQVANTHLQSGTGDKFQSIRKNQMDQIRDVLRAHKKPGVPQVLVGDLNIDAFKVEEFDSSLDRLGMSQILEGYEQEEDEAPEADPVPLIERLKKYVSAGFQASCIKEDSSDHPKFLDHVLTLDPEGKLRFKDDVVLNPTFPMNNMDCPLSDHKPRAVTIEL